MLQVVSYGIVYRSQLCHNPPWGRSTEISSRTAYSKTKVYQFTYFFDYITNERQASDGIVLDVRGISQAIKYYSVIGGGLGILGVILLLQIGAGGDGGSIISGLLSLVILSLY
jgi:hypothetical protein